MVLGTVGSGFGFIGRRLAELRSHRYGAAQEGLETDAHFLAKEEEVLLNEEGAPEFRLQAMHRKVDDILKAFPLEKGSFHTPFSRLIYRTITERFYCDLFSPGSSSQEEGKLYALFQQTISEGLPEQDALKLTALCEKSKEQYESSLEAACSEEIVSNEEEDGVSALDIAIETYPEAVTVFFKLAEEHRCMWEEVNELYRVAGKKIPIELVRAYEKGKLVIKRWEDEEEITVQRKPSEGVLEEEFLLPNIEITPFFYQESQSHRKALIVSLAEANETLLSGITRERESNPLELVKQLDHALEKTFVCMKREQLALYTRPDTSLEERRGALFFLEKIILPAVEIKCRAISEIVHRIETSRPLFSQKNLVHFIRECCLDGSLEQERMLQRTIVSLQRKT